MTNLTDTTTLTGFLLARIAEDQAAIEDAIESSPAPSGWWGTLRDTLDAHRTIVNEARNYSPELEHGDNGEWAFARVLHALALGYSSHADFDPAWAAVPS